MLHPFRFLIKDSPLYPALLIERFLPSQVRHILIAATRALTIVFLTLISLAPWAELFHYFGYGLDWWSVTLTKLFGFLFFTLSLWLFLSAGEMFYRSRFHRSFTQPEYLVTLDVGRVLYSAKSEDLLAAFLLAPAGRSVTARAGIIISELTPFLRSREMKTLTASLNFKPGELLDLKGFAALLWQNNKDWQDFLMTRLITEESWQGTVSWVEAAGRRHFIANRWWSRENLDRSPGLAKDWAYNQTPCLNRYRSEWSRIPDVSVLHETARVQLETILGREKGNKILLIGGTAKDRLAVLNALAAAIRMGKTTPALAHHQLIRFHTEMFVASVPDAATFKQELAKVFTETQKAKRVIAAIDDFGKLLATGESLGLAVEKFLEPDLRSREMQLVALMSSTEFNRYLSANSDFFTQFERVTITEPSVAEILPLLEIQIEETEKRFGLSFTYPALTELIAAAELTLANKSLIEKVEDLIDEMVSWAKPKKIAFLTRATATDFLRTKIGLSVGGGQTEEQAKLENLADLLQAKILGQQGAIEALVTTLKRSRLGVHEPKHPIATLLFLGPTGVGKTETAKALAQIFFGGEEKLIRLDMTDYETTEELERLKGSLALGKPGTLATIVRQQPHGVMLLEEFEKASPEILEIFFQIIDEGFFTDALGNRVNTRNLLLVATSNAGSDLLWQLQKDSKPKTEWEKALVDELTKRQIFKPEVLNRFDSTIIFEPLNPTSLASIAKIILDGLVKQLNTRGIRLKPTEALVNQVVNSGANQMFGAKPMVRFVRDRVEQSIADKIVAGELKPGQTIGFRAAQAGERTAPDFSVVAEIS